MEAVKVLERSNRPESAMVTLDDEDSITPGWDEDQDEIVSEEQMVKFRVEAILTRVWQEYDARMYTKQTTKMEFFDANYEKAKGLALKEIEDERLKKVASLVLSSLHNVILMARCIFSIAD